MKTIAICNHKGGVGKTALSMAIAEGLHRKGKDHICILFKHNEESKDSSKSGGYRVAPYVIDLGLEKN